MATIHKPNHSRSPRNKTREKRTEKISHEPGIFEYLGGHEVVHHAPTVLLHGKRVAAFGDDGLPLQDRSGRQIFERPGTPVRNDDGTPKLGGVPKVTKVPIDTRVVWGVSFPAGERIDTLKACEDLDVDAGELSFKLRCMGGFAEHSRDAADEAGEAAPKRGRPRKQATDEAGEAA